jgi:peroxiredoxin
MAAAEQEWFEGWEKGPNKTRWTELPLQVEDPAPDFELLDSNRKIVKLSQLWQDKPLLLMFWRHYGCSCGVDRAKRLNDEFSDYQSADANLAIIAQGEPERSAAYIEKYSIPQIPVLSNPDSVVYFAYGLVEGKESQILFDAPNEFLDRDHEAGMSLAKSRKEDDRPLVDNAWLLPGEFVIDTNGVVRLAYRYNYCEDFPDHRVLLAAIREAHLATK